MLDLLWAELGIQARPYIVKRLALTSKSASELRRFRRIDTLYRVEQASAISEVLPFSRQGWSKEHYEDELLSDFVKWKCTHARVRKVPGYLRRLVKNRIIQLRNEWYRRFQPAHSGSGFFFKSLAVLDDLEIRFSYYYFQFQVLGNVERFKQLYPTAVIIAHGFVRWESNLYAELAETYG